MVVKKNLEELVLLLKENGVDRKVIADVLIQLGFSEERIKSEFSKLSLLDSINEEPITTSGTHQSIDDVNLFNRDQAVILQRLDKIEFILNRNSTLLSQILEILMKPLSSR